MAAEAAAEPTSGGLWQTLGERLAFANYVPVPVPPELVEERAFVYRSGEPYHVLKQRHRHTYLSLTTDAYRLWRMMDGSKTIREIAVEFVHVHRRVAIGQLRGLVAELRDKGFLQDPPARVFSGLVERRQRRTLAHWPLALFRSIISRDLVKFRNGDAALGTLYRSIGWIFFTRPMVAIASLVVLAGLVAWAVELARGGHALAKTADSYVLGFVAVLLLDVLATSLHELGHALAAKHAGREVVAIGLLLYYGTPCAYVNTVDVWMADRRARIVTSWAGPFVTLILAGTMGLLASAAPAGSLVGDLAFKAATVWFFDAAFNFVPLLELDGYYILVDLLEMPQLRARAYQFLRQDLWRKLRRRAPWTREERILGLFGVLAATFSALMLGLTLWVWHLRGVGIADELWTLPAWYGKPLLVLFLLIFAGPLLLGLATLLVESLRWLYRQIAWRLSEQQLAHRAQPLLAALPYLEHLEPAERTALAQHLRPRRVAAGLPVVRQGDLPDGFYFIRDAEADVEQAGPGGAISRVAALGPGDHFGELAYLNRSPRNATVRARTPLELYHLDGGHFQRWVAEDMAGRAEVRRRMFDRAVLARVPALAGLTSTEHDRLYEHAGVERFAAGDLVFRQGEPGARVYLVAEGRFAVLVRAADDPPDGLGRIVAELSPGELFGEIALLHHVPRTASLRAVEPSVCYSLDRDGFGRLLDAAPTSRTSLDHLASRRLGETRAACGAAAIRDPRTASPKAAYPSTMAAPPGRPTLSSTAQAPG